MMFSRRLLLVVVTAVVCAWPAAAHAVVFGASVDGNFNNYTRGVWSWNLVQSSLQRLHAAGATVAQTGSQWAATEPGPPLHGQYRYDWDRSDTIVRGLAEAHLRWVPTLDYTPKWEQQHIKPAKDKWTTSPLPPRNNAVFGAYAAALARRYGPGGSFWAANPSLPRLPVTSFEIWNEPDCKWTWGPDVNLQDYARLYMSAYRAIKSVNRHAQVITGGLAFNQTSLPRLLKAFKGLPIDALGVHPYGSNAAATVAVVRWTTQETGALGRGRTPLIVDEYGWNSSRLTWQHVPRKNLRSDVRQSIIGLTRISRVQAVIPFEWTDADWGLSGGAMADGIKQALHRR